jgi:hypothetical protein
MTTVVVQVMLAIEVDSAYAPSASLEEIIKDAKQVANNKLMTLLSNATNSSVKNGARGIRYIKDTAKASITVEE